MERKQLTYRTEDLSTAEKAKLMRRFLFVLFVASLMGTFIYFFMAFFQKESSFGVVIPIVFECFFFGILIFIVSIHALNAFQKTKKVYTGIVTDKYAQSTKFRGSSSQNITHYIELDNVEFTLDQMFYDQCHKGDKIELNVLGKGRVFAVNTLVKAFEANHNHPKAEENNSEHKRNQIHDQAIFYQPTESYLELDEIKIINKKLLRAFIWRTVAGFAAMYVLFFIVFIVILMNTNDLKNIKNLFWIIIFTEIILYLWLNRRTYLLLKDRIGKRAIYETETVIDLERSNMPKPSKHSIVTYQGYSYRIDLFFYVQTAKHWTQVSQALYESLEAGDKISFKMSRNAKVVLDIKKLN